MLDHFLAWLVVIAPTIFALGLEIIDERIRKRPYWRWGVIVFGLSLSGLTWLQISWETLARENAIRATSQEVAAETSKQVTKAVTEQYSQMVADQKSQITNLQNQLAAQAKDVSAIKGSNIVTGKNPIKVEVTNEPPSSTSLQVENIRLLAEPESSIYADAPYAQKITIQTDAPVNPVHLSIFCDVALKYMGSYRPMVYVGTNEIYKQDSRIFTINMDSQGTAILRPDAPLVFHLYSEKPIKILKMERGPR